jgi:hypothetical protein
LLPLLLLYYAKDDVIVAEGSPADRMIILQQGVANKSETLAGRSQSITLTTGAALGADMIVKRDTCRRTYEVRAVTFVMVTILHRHKLLEILNSPRFEVTRGAFRKIVFRTIFRKEFVRYARMFARIHGARQSHEYDALEHNTTRVAVVRDKGSAQHDEEHLEAQAAKCRRKEEKVKECTRTKRPRASVDDHGEVNAALAAGGVPRAAAPSYEGAGGGAGFGGGSGPSVSSGHIALLSKRMDKLEDSQVRQRSGRPACSIALLQPLTPPPHTHTSARVALVADVQSSITHMLKAVGRHLGIEDSAMVQQQMLERTERPANYAY